MVLYKERVEHTWLDGIIPTAENLALAFWQRLEPALSSGLLYSVRVGETEKNWAECVRSS